MAKSQRAIDALPNYKLCKWMALMRVLKYLLTGRRPVLVAAAILLLGLFLGVRITGTIASAWEAAGVPALTRSFADTRTITHAIECRENGRDPFIDTSCDPW